MQWYPNACPVCGGVLHEEVGDPAAVTCLMCARSFAASDLVAVQRLRRRASFARPAPRPAQAA